MHRLLVETSLLERDAPELPADAARHLRVVRPQRGERIELFDGRGRWRVYEWGDGLRAAGEAQFAARPSASVALFACVTKGSRWDWTIEKATELGVTRIVPVISDRTIVRIPKGNRTAKCERWLRVAEDAARQSDAMWLPEIHEAVDFQESLALVRETDCFVGALVKPPPPSLAGALQKHLELQAGPANISIYVGPEGDFTAGELSLLLDVATPTSFGPTILRAETAAVFSLSVAVAALASRNEVRSESRQA